MQGLPMDSVTKNNGVIAGIVDLAQNILRKTLEFTEITDAQQDKVNLIQELINEVKHETLELEKMGK